MAKSARLDMRVDQELKDELKQLAKDARRDLTEYVVILLEDHVKASRKGKRK